MRKAFAFRFSAEATSDKNIRLLLLSDIGYGAANLGGRTRQKRSKAHGQEIMKFTASGLSDSGMLSGANPTIRHSMFPRPRRCHIFFLDSSAFGGLDDNTDDNSPAETASCASRRTIMPETVAFDAVAPTIEPLNLLQLQL